MKIQLSSVLVEDQAKALSFYTDVLGFSVKQDIPFGDDRWLTVVASDSPNGPELLLEPMSFAPARQYQKELYEAGIPSTAFMVADMASEVERLESSGVDFRVPPTDVGTATIAVFEDTCGNLIQLYQTVS